MKMEQKQYGTHTIRVSDETYVSLKALKFFQRAREMTFDDVLDDLIDFYLRVGEP